MEPLYLHSLIISHWFRQKLCLNILESKPLSHPSLIGLRVGWGGPSKSKEFSSLPWLLHFSGPSCVSLNISVISQSARDMQRAYVGFLLLCNFQSSYYISGWYITHHSHRAECFLCLSSTELTALTYNAIKHGLFTLHFKSSLPLFSAVLVFNSCPALVKWPHVPSRVVGRKQS